MGAGACSGMKAASALPSLTASPLHYTVSAEQERRGGGGKPRTCLFVLQQVYINSQSFCHFRQQDPARRLPALGSTWLGPWGRPGQALTQGCLPAKENGAVSTDGILLWPSGKIIKS